jgi:PAS domain S-box-containing protein
MEKNNNVLSNEIQVENDYYKSIIENNSFYIVRTDLLGNYTYINPFFCKMLSVTPDEWIGKPSMGLILPFDHQICADTVAKCFLEPEKSHWVILRKPIPNGVLSTQWEFSLLADEDGAPKEVLCIGHDITPQVLKQEELQALVDITSQQNKRLVNFTYIISHNIRSHVANIIGIINLNSDGDEEEKKMSWELIQSSTNSLDATIQNLNEVISIQSKTNLPLSKIAIKQEVIRISESIEILMLEANTSIDYQLEPEEYVLTNSAYFESILLNLLTNAFKYKSADRDLEIIISTEETKNYKVLIFKDNGSGIDLARYKDELFGMYKTFHGNTDAKGLGLFIIRAQIEAMKGKIEAESELGLSTTFKIYFRRSPFDMA